MDLSSAAPPPEMIGEFSLRGWRVIGCGGFGQIYRARHHEWCYDVAVKLLHKDDGKSSCLLREAKMMREGSCEFVMQVLGVFKGRVPNYGPAEQLGLVMKFMERGSLTTLQENLCGAPPLPLVFRLAHQVAVGMNFLHSRQPALLHLDLKPSNVLLDSDLNVKLTDFGLAKIYQSVTRTSKKDGKDEGGTIKYMPPEAFGLSYKPNKASDIYSYGILLWSIVTGKQPYPNAMSSILRFRIPQGDRPDLEDYESVAGGRAELMVLLELIVQCWHMDHQQRPRTLYCATKTEELYLPHRDTIADAVHHVRKALDILQENREDDRMIQQVQRIHVNLDSAANVQNDVPTGRSPVQVARVAPLLKKPSVDVESYPPVSQGAAYQQEVAGAGPVGRGRGEGVTGEEEAETL